MGRRYQSDYYRHFIKNVRTICGGWGSNPESKHKKLMISVADFLIHDMTPDDDNVCQCRTVNISSSDQDFYCCRLDSGGRADHIINCSSSLGLGKCLEL